MLFFDNNVPFARPIPTRRKKNIFRPCLMEEKIILFAVHPPPSLPPWKMIFFPQICIDINIIFHISMSLYILRFYYVYIFRHYYFPFVLSLACSVVRISSTYKMGDYEYGVSSLSSSCWLPACFFLLVVRGGMLFNFEKLCEQILLKVRALWEVAEFDIVNFNGFY
jgi:hypothetical protein